MSKNKSSVIKIIFSFKIKKLSTFLRGVKNVQQYPNILNLIKPQPMKQKLSCK